MKKPYITIGHVVIEIMVLAMVIASFMMAITTKGTIPVHLNMVGDVDAHGTPMKYLPAVIIMFAFDIFMGCIVFLAPAKIFNVPFKINPKNETLVYRDMTLMILGVQLLLTITIFSSILISILSPENMGRGIAIINTVCGILGLADIVAGFVVAAIDNKR